MSNAPYNLSELVTDIKITLQNRYEQPIWVVAEINELNLNRSGHCYMELVEKDSESDKILAKCRATAWAFTYRTIQAYFESTTAETLRSGLKVLVKVNVEFHEVFGFSLNIQDIDPRYTLGDLARRKLEIIQRLEQEGVLDMNAGVQFPMVPQRIAVISSETAAGFGDFTQQLNNNTNGYAFYVELFQAIMQGENAPSSMINSLEQIFNRIDDFDCIAILRGGGSKSDLSCFDDYNLAYFVTQFPLPIITGIGHDRDNTVVDMVAHTALKTPTAVAEFLIDEVAKFDERLEEYNLHIAQMLQNYFDSNLSQLEMLSHALREGAIELVQLQNEALFWFKSRLINSTDFLQMNHLHRLENKQNRVVMNAKTRLSNQEQYFNITKARIERSVKVYMHSKDNQWIALSGAINLVNPQKVLDRGFAIVTHKGEFVKNYNQLTLDDEIDIRLAKGTVGAKVSSISPE